MYIKKSGIQQYSHLFWLIPVALALRLGWAFYDMGCTDTIMFNIPWAINGAKDLFGLYAKNTEFVLDYPPLIPTILSILGKPIAAATDKNVQLYLIKIIPCIADAAIVPLLYKMQVEVGAKHIVWLPLLWAINPSAIFNCSVWGQVDGILMLLIVCMFYAILRKNPYAVCGVFALGCLAKLQMAYLLPVLILYLIIDCRGMPIIKRLFALLFGLGIGILGWLPFMPRGGGITLPLDIYFGGFDKYPSITLNAANFYAFLAQNLQDDSKLLMNLFSFKQFSDFVMIILFVAFAVLIFAGLNNRVYMPTCVVALVYMNTIFMFTTRMHERYQMPAMILAFLCYISTQKIAYFVLGAGLSIVTGLNQWICLFNNVTTEAFVETNHMLKLFSYANIVLYILMCALAAFELAKAIKRSKMIC